MDLKDATAGGGPTASSSSDFVRKLYKMLENPTDENVVRWGDAGDSFVVLENEKFTKHILPKHFKHSNFASFVRQLNKYDFHKVRHNNEENGQSPYGSGAWEFRHPDFQANNKDALDNIRRKAPAARKPNPATEDLLVPTQQMDLVNSQLVATQQQLQQLQHKYDELSVQHTVLMTELIGVQKTVVNHEHVMQSVMSFLHSIDEQRRRDGKTAGFPHMASSDTNDSSQQTSHPAHDGPASPLQHASKLLSETNADMMLNTRNLEQLNEQTIRMNGSLTVTPPPDHSSRNGPRSGSRDIAPPSATSTQPMRARHQDLDALVYPVGQTNGIDPMYSEHINNIPYSMPPKLEVADPRSQTAGPRKKSTQLDPGWVRPPQILLVEDDDTCRRIGSKFLVAFNCAIESANDGLEAVNKLNSGKKFDLVLMDIIMPNLDGVSATHLIRQVDPVPIIAMTSNIRSDDISMYFHHGMNDVLPKPFTKDGLLAILDKHLEHIKKPAGGMIVDTIGSSARALAPQSARQSIKADDSPAGSPATVSTWNSPSQLPGVSPVGSGMAEEYISGLPGHHSAFGVSPITGAMPYSNSSQMQIGVRQGPHRRQISEISGGESLGGDVKRQQMYAGIQAPGLNPMQPPR